MVGLFDLLTFAFTFFISLTQNPIYLGEVRWLKVKALVSTSHTSGFKSIALGQVPNLSDLLSPDL